MKNAAGRFALFLVGFYLLSGGVQAQTITSLTLSPSTITGGSSGASTGTVFLNTPAPAGGTVVALSSSNTALAASLTSVTVAEGATSATFTVVTNPRYRDYSGLSFTATISASANGSSASANLTVTAHPLPPDITSNNGVYEGFMCGGNYPAYNGEPGILYQCFKSNPPSNSLFGPCIFIQECLLGCQRNPPNQTKFKDSCSITGAY